MSNLSKFHLFIYVMGIIVRYFFNLPLSSYFYLSLFPPKIINKQTIIKYK